MNAEQSRMMVRNSVAKRRHFMFGDGKKLELETQPIVSSGRISTPRMRDIRMDKQTPPLSKSDVDKIQAIYSEARTISADTGVKHHVDHICPLAKGGAHHWLNMEIVSADSNLCKGAKWNGVDGYTYNQLV